MSKVTLNDLSNLQNENTAVTKINQNSQIIEDAFDNTLSRDGSTPNQMNADLDMNSKDVLNVNTLSTSELFLNGVEVVESDLSALAKIPDGDIFSNIQGSPASPKGNSLSDILDHVVSSERGSLITRKSTGWTGLVPGISGQVLRTNGTGSDVSWSNGAGTGDLVSTNNLSDVQNNITSINNLKVYGDCIDIRRFGYLADGVTDNTSAVNSAIALANTTGNITILIPQGIGLVGGCSPITANNVWFKAMGTPGTCVLKGTSTSMLQWGDPDLSIIDTGGCEGISFQGTGNAASNAVQILNAQGIFFNSCMVGDGLANFISCGSAGVYSGMICIDNLMGHVPNLNAPLIRLVNGSGLFVTGGNVYNQASQGQAMDSRDFIQITGSWNTVSVKNMFAFLFDHAVFALLTSGQNLGDIMLTNNYFDEMNEAILLFMDTGASCGNVDIHYNEMTGKRFCGIRLVGAGFFIRVSIHGNVIRETKKDGIGIYSPVTLLSMIGNDVTQTNEVCSFEGSIAGTTLTVTQRFGAPGGTLVVGDVITGTGVTGGTTITAVPANQSSFPGVYTVSPSQTVALTADMATTTGHNASLYMASGSDQVYIIGNNFGPKSSSLGTGYGAYGVEIDGGVNFKISNNTADGVTGTWNVTGLTSSSSDATYFTYTPTISDTAGGSVTATATASYTRNNNRIKGNINGNVSAASGTGYLKFTLPQSAERGGVGSGVIAGGTCTAPVNSGDSYGILIKYDGTATSGITGDFQVSFDYIIHV